MNSKDLRSRRRDLAATLSAAKGQPLAETFRAFVDAEREHLFARVRTVPSEEFERWRGELLALDRVYDALTTPRFSLTE